MSCVKLRIKRCPSKHVLEYENKRKKFRIHMNFRILHDPSDFFNPLDHETLENIIRFSTYLTHTHYGILVAKNFYL